MSYNANDGTNDAMGELYRKYPDATKLGTILAVRICLAPAPTPSRPSKSTWHIPGSFHTQEIFRAFEVRQIYQPATRNWVGNVPRGGLFIKDESIPKYKHSNKQRNLHEREIPRWRLHPNWEILLKRDGLQLGPPIVPEDVPSPPPDHKDQIGLMDGDGGSSPTPSPA